MRVLFFGDVVGRPGRQAVATVLPRWRAIHRPDIILANGENAASGKGITPNVAEELFRAGVDVLTLGNHAFFRKEAAALIETDARVLRPANYPAGVPGNEYGIFAAGEARLAVVNLLGRVFLDALDDPFQKALTLIPLLRAHTPCILIDMHAEATSEKAALAWMLDGQVSAVIGTHTHVATADERVLPGGTGFITDVGMVGPRDSILGVKTESVIAKFLTHLPTRFEVAEDTVQVNAILLDLRASDGFCEQCLRLQEIIPVAAP